MTTEKLDREFIFLYEAVFSSELLSMLDAPTLATRPTTWPTIQFKRIPFKPYADFQSRVIAELLLPGSHEATKGLGKTRWDSISRREADGNGNGRMHR